MLSSWMYSVDGIVWHLLTLLRFHRRGLTRSDHGRFLIWGRWVERRDILLLHLIPGPAVTIVNAASLGE